MNRSELKYNKSIKNPIKKKDKFTLNKFTLNLFKVTLNLYIQNKKLKNIKLYLNKINITPLKLLDELFLGDEEIKTYKDVILNKNVLSFEVLTSMDKDQLFDHFKSFPMEDTVYEDTNINGWVNRDQLLDFRKSDIIII